MSRNLTKSEVQAKNNAIIIGMFLSNKHFPVIFSIKVIFCDKKTTFHIQYWGDKIKTPYESQHGRNIT